MAKTITEIANSMKVDFVRNETMRTAFGLTDYNSNVDEAELVSYFNANFSAVSVVTVLLYIVSTCAAAVENMFDWFTEDISNMIDSERYGHKGWYENTAKAFQYQDGNGVDYELDPDTGEYVIIDTNARIVTCASCKNSSGYGVTLKVAKGDVGALSPLTDDEKSAFSAYINRLKPAGIPVTIISREADRLALDLTCYYDPLIFNSTTALSKIKEVITAYLQGIEFNGEYITMTMVDKLQAIPGLDVIEVHSVVAQHAGYEYESIERNARYIPVSGYMIIGDDADQNIELIANI